MFSQTLRPGVVTSQYIPFVSAGQETFNPENAEEGGVMCWKYLLVIFLISGNVFAAFEKRAQGSPLMIFGGGLVASAETPWSAFANPAGLNTISHRLLAVSYTPQPFGLKELAHGSFAYTEPTSIGVFALSGSRTGSDLYREATITVSFATAVANGFSTGVNINYYSLAIENYGSASSFGVDIGGLLSIADDVRWGFSALNLNAPAIGESKESLPQVFSTSVCYEPFDAGNVSVNVVKDVRYPMEFIVGMEYSVIESVTLRTGASLEPSLFNAGLGLAFSFVKLDYGFSSHTELGLTHQASLTIILDEF